MRYSHLTTTAIAMVVVLSIGCAGTGGTESPGAQIDRAIAAMGGTQALGNLKSVTIAGSHRHYEPQQARQVGQGTRFGGQSTFVAQRDLSSGTVRIDWDRRLVSPRPAALKYSEVLAHGVGYVYGIDSSTRTAESLKSDPPQHRMSRVRLATAQREIERISPRLLLDMRANPAAVTSLPAEQLGGRMLPALRYQSGANTFIVLFDPVAGLPERVRTIDTDAMWGDASYEVLFFDWRQIGDVKLPFAYDYFLRGSRTAQVRIDRIDVNPALAASLFEIPAHARTAEAAPVPSAIPYQWIIRRGQWGSLVDHERIVFDPGASKGLRLVDIAPGISHVVGASHNSLVVELGDYLVVFDAPVGESQSAITIDLAKQRYPGKPIRFLVLTHHHMDHASGLRTFAAEGANVIVGQRTGDYIRHMLTAPATAQPDRLARNPRRVEVIEVVDQYTLGEGARTVEVYHIDNTHSVGMLIGHMPHAKLGFVTDLWSPGRDPIGPTQGQTELARAVLKLGIPVERFAGGHGTTGSFKELADAVAKKGK
jgi:glyoxylase-like metal-dependent hydrolase (beta-lactamase superfamily II)